MNNLIKIIGILFVGLIVAIVIYPFCHELGHAVAAVLVGARVVDGGLFPNPFISCEVSGVGNLGLELIGLGGLFLPFLLSLIFSSKNFWAWYGLFVMKYISLIGFIISFFSILFPSFNAFRNDEDIIKIIDSKAEADILMILMIFASFVAIYSMLKQKPLDKVKRFFGITG